MAPCAQSPVLGTEGMMYPCGHCALLEPSSGLLQPTGWSDWGPLGSVQGVSPGEKYLAPCSWG